MKLIAEAIIKVMKAVEGMEKNSTVGTGNYAYNGTKDSDVKEVFNKALSEAGLCILPTNVDESHEVSRWVENGRQKQSVFTTVTTKYLLLHTSGESVELAGYGHGVDAQDKGAGKATTYALKNCLLYTFLTPVRKIDDSDEIHSKDIPVPVEKKPEPKKIVQKELDEDMYSKSLKLNASQIKKVLGEYVMPIEMKKGLESQLNELQK